MDRVLFLAKVVMTASPIERIGYNPSGDLY